MKAFKTFEAAFKAVFTADGPFKLTPLVPL